ncbi:MAG: RNA polymerase sigma factor [Sediminibacterium sp.]
MSNSDLDWVKRVLEGDEDAYRNLIRAYQDMAYAIAIAVVKDEHLAQEVVQDAFLKAYQRLNQFKLASSFKTWFYRIVTNEALMCLRKKKRNNLVFIELPENEVGYGDFTNEDLGKYVEQALLALPSKESLVLRLFYLEQMKIQAVTDVTGWTAENVKVILHRARKRMKQIINELIKKDKHAS